VVDLAFGASLLYEPAEGFAINTDGEVVDDSLNTRNHVNLSLPLYFEAGESIELVGSISFQDDDLFDGELSPGFSADLSGIGQGFDELVFVAMDELGESVIQLRSELVPTYDVHGNQLTSGNDVLTDPIPGLQANLNGLLGLSELLNIGQYIRHYLTPQLGADRSGFELDQSISLGQLTDEAGVVYTYYGVDPGDPGLVAKPTMAGFLEYLEDHWVPNLGGQAGMLSWQFVDADGDGEIEED